MLRLSWAVTTTNTSSCPEVLASSWHDYPALRHTVARQYKYSPGRSHQQLSPVTATNNFTIMIFNKLLCVVLVVYFILACVVSSPTGQWIYIPWSFCSGDDFYFYLGCVSPSYQYILSKSALCFVSCTTAEWLYTLRNNRRNLHTNFKFSCSKWAIDISDFL